MSVRTDLTPAMKCEYQKSKRSCLKSDFAQFIWLQFEDVFTILAQSAEIPGVIQSFKQIRDRN